MNQKPKITHQPEIGSVSTDTLKESDLIEAFKDVYEYLTGEVWHVTACDDEEVGELLDALNQLCPENMYFGPHPGDGADFGFWEFEDQTDEN